MTLLPLLILSLSPVQIDGLFQDWDEGINHQEDSRFIYKRIELPNRSCLQQLAKQKIVELGGYTIFFSPTGKGYGVSCKKGNDWISPYEAGIVFAPTTAATNFELRVNKPDATQAKKTFTFVPTRNSDLRVVSWNVKFGNLLKDKDRSARLLKALQPNILLLQELDGNDSPEELNLFLQKTLGGVWKTDMSSVHGTKPHHQLRSAVSTSLDATNMTEIKGVKAVCCNINIKEKPIHIISLHLRCCGGPTGEAEQRRQEEAAIIRATIENTISSRWVIAGDWNLVGTTKPLEIVKTNQFATVNAYQPDGLLNATWSDTASSFTPGRLDWMLYSPKSLELLNCFVLDTLDVNNDILMANDLLAEDTAELSDHLPLVADFKLIK